MVLPDKRSVFDISGNLIERLLAWACVLLGVYVVLFFTVRGWARIHYLYSLNLGEAPLAQAVQIFREGVWPYRRLDSPPYSLTPYGPVFLILASAANAFFGETPMAAGRFVTLLASLGSTFVIARILVSSGVSFRNAAIAAGLFLSLPYLDRWGVQVNVDILAIFWEVTAVWMLMEWSRSAYKSRVFFLLGVLFGLLAFFTKASAIAGTGAFFWFLIFQKRWRECAVYTVTLGAGVLALYGLMNHLTDGMYYFHTAYEISKRTFYYQFIGGFWQAAFKVMPLSCIAAAVALVWPSIRKQHLCLYLYLVLCILMTVSLGKQGSETNYFLAFCASSSIAVGLLLGGPVRRSPSWIAWTAFALIFWQLWTYYPYNPKWMKYSGRFEKQTEFFDRLTEQIRKVPGPVISWDMSLLLAAGKQIYYEPFPMAQMSYSGVWDESPIIRDIEAHRFKFAILYFFAPVLKADRNFTQGFLTAFKKHYRCIGRSSPPWNPKNLMFFYVPNEPSGTPDSR